MSTEARAAVALILKNCEVTFSAILKGEKVRSDGGTKWKCDEWSVSFTVRDGRAAHEEFEYFTGIGHRKAPEWKFGVAGFDNGPAPRPGTLLHETWMKQAKPVAPDAADVLYSLLLDSSAVDQSFESWCSEYGYDSDSRKAEATYRACQENADKLARVFDSVARDALKKALEDF